MLSSLTWHDFISGLLALLVIVGTMGLLAAQIDIPATLWAFDSAIIAYFFGTQKAG